MRTEEFEMLAQMIDQKFEKNNEKMEARLDAMEERLTSKIEATEARLDKKIEATKDQLKEQIDITEERFNGKMEMMELQLRQVIAVVAGNVKRVEIDIRDLRLDIDNLILPRIKLLTEVYLPVSRDMEKRTTEIDDMKLSVSVLNLSAMDHTKRIEKLEACAC